MPFTPTVYTYGADKQPVEYTGEYLSGPMDQHICGYCDSHGFGDSLSAAIETPSTPSLATAAPVLSAPVVEPVVPETPIDKSEEVFKSSPKAAAQGIGAEDGSSLFEGVANLGLLKSQAMAALKGKYDITDEHLEHLAGHGRHQAAFVFGSRRSGLDSLPLVRATVEVNPPDITHFGGMGQARPPVPQGEVESAPVVLNQGLSF